MQESLEGFSKWHADQILSNSKEENPLIFPDSTPVQNWQREHLCEVEFGAFSPSKLGIGS